VQKISGCYELRTVRTDSGESSQTNRKIMYPVTFINLQDDNANLTHNIAKLVMMEKVDPISNSMKEGAKSTKITN
jgi:hypothetical protein